MPGQRDGHVIWQVIWQVMWQVIWLKIVKTQRYSLRALEMPRCGHTVYGELKSGDEVGETYRSNSLGYFWLLFRENAILNRETP